MKSTNRTTKVRPSAKGLTLLLAMALVMVASVSAMPGVAEAQTEGEVTVEGRGALYAKGTGDVDIDMGGRIWVRVAGDVTIVDHAGDMRVRLRGEADDNDQERLTNVVLTDFRGIVNVRGTDFSITIDGDVVLGAQGRGEANLVGEGTYKTRHGDRTVWDGMVQLGDPQIEPAA